jgi:hypothetical protein
MIFLGNMSTALANEPLLPKAVSHNASPLQATGSPLQPRWIPAGFGDEASPQVWRLLEAILDQEPAAFRNQYGVPSPGGALQGIPLTGGLLGGSSILPAIVPSVSIAQRYDTNVFNTPKIAGLERDDFVTTISPQIALIPRTGGLIRGSLQLGGIAEYYAKHPEVSYLGGNLGGSLDLTRLVQQGVPRMTLLVADTFTYTPQPPAFLTGGAVNAAGDPADQDPASAFARGLQVQRVNTITNSASVISTYAVTPTLSLYMNAAHGLQRFGATPGAQGVASLVSTDFRSLSAGPQISLSPNETVRLLFTHARTDFLGGQVSGFPPYFETNGGLITYRRPLLTPALIGFASISVQEVIPSHSLQYVGSASVTWTRFPDTVSVSYSRQVSPSFLAVGAPVTTDLVSLGITRTLGPRLSATLAANYARSQSIAAALPTNVPNAPANLSFDSYLASASFIYRVAPGLLISGNYLYSFFQSEGLTPAAGVIGVTGEPIRFDRHMVLLQLQKVWF